MRKDLELEDERIAEKRYAEKLRQKASKASPYQGPASTFWTKSGVPKPPKIPVGELVGRVALANPDDMLGNRNDFYIGEKHVDLDGIEVFSWTAPIACSFYRQNHRHEAHNGLGQLCDDVAVIRSFVHRNGQIVDFTDDFMRDGAPSQPFRKQGLAIPEPPNRPSLPLRDVPRPPEPAPVNDEAHTQPSPPRPLTSRQHRHADHGVPPVRAEDALRAQLEAPRTKSLTPVLSTLQPDQYELVTIPAMDSMIIEGKPGTGKTIIASHRAAYLVNDDTPPENALDGNVLLIGPTTGYSNHVRGIVNRLGGGTERIKVLSLPELMWTGS